MQQGLEEMVGAAIELVSADKGNVQLLNHDGVLTIEAQRGFERDFLEYFCKVSAQDDSACGRALRSGLQVVIEDVETDEPYAAIRHIARAAGYRAVISTPLISGDGAAQGVLSTHFRSAHRPTNWELNRIALYARHASDFIHRCKIEQNLRRSEEELREADRRKNEFLALLGHELRNPLHPISTATELLTRTLTNEMHIRPAAIIKRQAAQLSRLVDDLLDVARITQGRIDLRREPLDLGTVIAQAIESVGPLIRDRQHELAVVSNYEALYVNGDLARLVQCVANLLTNAAKYTGPHGKIRVQARAEESNVVIEISDSGAGISAELLPKVFDLFVQSDRTLDRSQGGLGIGLSVVKRLIEMHGGVVAAHSAGLGHGSTFTLQLPRIDRPQVTGLQQNRLEAPRRRILIVDDNVDAANSLAALLSHEGHETRVAYSGRDALESVDAFLPEVALLDIGLPEMDGYQVAHHLRARSDLNDLKLIALTGYGQVEDRQQTRAAGFDAHLVKPVDLLALEDVLSRGL